MSAATNKEVVRRFNKEVIQDGNADSFHALMAADFVNHAAPQGMSTGPDGMWNTFENVLRPALSDLNVTIHDQLAEGDKVTTRKTISGLHTGPLLGVPPTGKRLSIDVIDIVRVDASGKYAEHWGLNTMPQLLAALRQS